VREIGESEYMRLGERRMSPIGCRKFGMSES